MIIIIIIIDNDNNDDDDKMHVKTKDVKEEEKNIKNGKY
jgi:hypothetical protein